MLKPLLLLAFAATVPSFAHGQTTVTKAAFGTLPDHSAVEQYTLANSHLQIKIITFGATITSILAPDRDGKKTDVILGYDDLQGYLDDDKTHMGSIVGRYGNRIAKGTFTLAGEPYHLPLNNGPNTLHGGTIGFDRHNWTAKQLPNGVEFSLISPDGDQGFPGTLTAHVRYTLSGTDLRIEYSATTDKLTVLNLTNHTYFNLIGSGTILGEKMMINSARITAVDATLIPTGQYLNIAGTALDFQNPTVIGDRINSTDGEAGRQLTFAGGYDHNFVLKPSSAPMHLAAKVTDPASGRVLTVTTTEPAVQFYSGNSLLGATTGRNGMKFEKNTGFCLETQHYPDSPNQPNFPSTELKPGATFHSTTVFQFTTLK